MTPIYIMTYRRPRVLTLEQFSPALRKRAVLVVDAQDRKALAPKYPDVQMLTCPKQGKGCAKVRQWLVERAKKAGERLCCFADDDLRFHSPVWEGEKKRFRKSSPEQVERGFRDLEKKADEMGVAFTSTSNPFFNTFPEKWQLCAYGNCVFVVNIETLTASRARFDITDNRSDLSFMLQCWTAGFPSYVSLDFAISNCGSSAEGGESLRDPEGNIPKGMRTRAERHNEAYRILLERFPKYLTEVRVDNARARHIGSNVDARCHGLAAYLDNMKVLPRTLNDVKVGARGAKKLAAATLNLKQMSFKETK